MSRLQRFLRKVLGVLDKVLGVLVETPRDSTEVAEVFSGVLKRFRCYLRGSRGS